MPKPRQGLDQRPSIPQLVQNVETSSAALGERATALSAAIERIDERLRVMPGKIPAAVEGENVVLHFAKLGAAWGLWVEDEDCDIGSDGPIPRRIVDLSVARKAKAFPLLPILLAKIDALQREQVAEIDKAFALVEDLGGL